MRCFLKLEKFKYFELYNFCMLENTHLYKYRRISTAPNGEPVFGITIPSDREFLSLIGCSFRIKRFGDQIILTSGAKG